MPTPRHLSPRSAVSWCRQARRVRALAIYFIQLESVSKKVVSLSSGWDRFDTWLGQSDKYFLQAVLVCFFTRGFLYNRECPIAIILNKQVKERL